MTSGKQHTKSSKPQRRHDNAPRTDRYPKRRLPDTRSQTGKHRTAAPEQVWADLSAGAQAVQYSLLTMQQKLFPRMEQRTSVKAAAPGNPADESRKTGVLAQKSLRFFTPAIENSFPHNSPKPANNTTGNLAQGEEKQ